MVKVYNFEIGNITTGENQIQPHKSTRERIEKIKGRVIEETGEEVSESALHDGKYIPEPSLKTKVGWIPKRFIIRITQSPDHDLYDVYYVLGQGPSPTVAQTQDVEKFLAENGEPT